MTDSKKLSPEELQGPDKTSSGLLCRTQGLSILFQGELSRLRWERDRADKAKRDSGLDEISDQTK